MAKITFKGQSEYFKKLQQLDEHFSNGAALEKAVSAGAAVVADQIRANLEGLPTESFRYLGDGEIFHGLPESQKQDLADSFGLTPIKMDSKGFIHTKAGFDGYGSHPTKAYPQGLPNQLLARAVESGSSVRAKMPFVEPAVRATRQQAIKAMEEVIDEELKNIF